jgi:hypothetical protein
MSVIASSVFKLQCKANQQRLLVKPNELFGKKLRLSWQAVENSDEMPVLRHYKHCPYRLCT